MKTYEVEYNTIDSSGNVVTRRINIDALTVTGAKFECEEFDRNAYNIRVIKL